jgi:hypothetical protein
MSDAGDAIAVFLATVALVPESDQPLRRHPRGGRKHAVRRLESGETPGIFS